MPSISGNELIGGVAIDATGEALTKETLKECIKADAVLLGAVGSPKYDNPLNKVRLRMVYWRCVRAWASTLTCAPLKCSRC